MQHAASAPRRAEPRIFYCTGKYQSGKLLQKLRDKDWRLRNRSEGRENPRNHVESFQQAGLVAPSFSVFLTQVSSSTYHGKESSLFPHSTRSFGHRPLRQHIGGGVLDAPRPRLHVIQSVHNVLLRQQDLAPPRSDLTN